MSSTRDLPAAFQVARETWDSRQFDYPLDPYEPEHFTLTRKYHIDVNAYNAGVRPPQFAADSEFPNLRMMWQRRESQVDNLLFFTRLFANKPQSWSVPGSTVLTIPGLNVTPTLGGTQNITAVTNSTSSSVQFLTVSAHGYSVDDIIRVRLTMQNGAGQQYAINGTFPVLSGTTTNVIRISAGQFVGITMTIIGTATVDKFTAGLPIRSPVTRSVATSTVRDYFIIGQDVVNGVLIQSESDVPLFPVFEAVDSDSAATDTLDTTTTPPAADYWSMVQSRAKLVASCVMEDPLYDAILVRATTYWTAQ